MHPILRESLFSEPSGRSIGLVQFAAAVIFLGIYASSAGSGGFALFLAASSLLSGTAESLPSDRRRAAGVLRITAILACVAMFTLLAVVPNVFL